MVRPTPRAFPSGRTVVFAGFVPIYSGGTARDLHPLPLTRGVLKRDKLYERNTDLVKVKLAVTKLYGAA